MRSVQRKLYFLLNMFFINSIIFAQYDVTKTCIGSNKDEVIYPKYFDRKNSDYNFKCNDGSSIYFFYSNSTDGDFAPNKGYNDLVVLKINTNGQIDFTKNIGNSFYEKVSL